MSKWKTIDSAPMGITVWAKVEGVNAITGKPYKKAKVVLNRTVVLNQMPGGIVARMEDKEDIDYLPIETSDTESHWPLTHWKPVKQSKWSVKNPGKLKLKDMYEEDAYEVFKAWRKDVGADNKTLYVFDWDGYWVEYLNDLLCPYSIYRVKRQDVPEGVVKEEYPPLWEVDWNKVDKRCRWVAVDDGDVVWGTLMNLPAKDALRHGNLKITTTQSALIKSL